MKYMVVETFAPGCKADVYDRFREKGRMLPDGLSYIDSWLEKDGDTLLPAYGDRFPTAFR
ncbi:MAG: hypothetical protein QOF24_80 [Verrucomicrobiota bacterium]